MKIHTKQLCHFWFNMCYFGSEKEYWYESSEYKNVDFCNNGMRYLSYDSYLEKGTCCAFIDDMTGIKEAIDKTPEKYKKKMLLMILKGIAGKWE